jgi:hypothetical protein
LHADGAALGLNAAWHASAAGRLHAMKQPRRTTVSTPLAKESKMSTQMPDSSTQPRWDEPSYTPPGGQQKQKKRKRKVWIGIGVGAVLLVGLYGLSQGGGSARPSAVADSAPKHSATQQPGVNQGLAPRTRAGT